MSDCYYQHCIIGIKIDLEKTKKIIDEAVYEDQKRYDPKTGKLSGFERVIIKEEVVEYDLFGFKFNKINSLHEICCNALKNLKTDLRGIRYHYNLDYNRHIVHFGIIYDHENCGKFNPIEKTLSINEINDAFEKVKKVFPEHEIKMYLFEEVC